MLADCLHDLTALGPGGLPTLLGALFLAGLAGGVTHCAGMCAPFVLAQAAATADRTAAGGTLRRLAGAALLPYHLGRMLGYATLGGLAGGLAGVVTLASGGLRFGLAALLGVAALLMFAQASTRVAAVLPRLPAPRLPGVLAGRLEGLLAAPTGWRGVALGLTLSALPCGLLYGALAGAAAAGSALGGALGMAVFVLGTVPGLAGLALLGRLFGRRVGGGRRCARRAPCSSPSTVRCWRRWRCGWRVWPDAPGLAATACEHARCGIPCWAQIAVATLLKVEHTVAHL